MSDWRANKLSIVIPTLDAVGLFVDGRLVGTFSAEELEEAHRKLAELREKKKRGKPLE